MSNKIFSVLVIIVALVGEVTTSHARPYTRPKKTINKRGNSSKFGPLSGVGVMSGKLGVGAEYPLIDALVLQYDQVKMDAGENAIVTTKSVGVPIHLRWYPGNDRQFCWFLGTRIGWAVSGNVTFFDGNYMFVQKNTALEKAIDAIFRRKEHGIKLTDLEEQDKVHNFQISIGGGFDYEFEFGLITGISYHKELIRAIQSTGSTGGVYAGMPGFVWYMKLGQPEKCESALFSAVFMNHLVKNTGTFLYSVIMPVCVSIMVLNGCSGCKNHQGGTVPLEPPPSVNVDQQPILMFEKVSYAPHKKTMSYRIKNSGPALQNVKLMYQVTSDAKKARLNNVTEGSIDIPLIAAQGVSKELTFSVDFQGEDQVIVCFFVVYNQMVYFLEGNRGDLLVNQEAIDELLKKTEVVSHDQAFFLSAMGGLKDKVVALIEGSLISKINTQDNYGRTALHHAAAWGRSEVVAYLLSQGMEVNALDNHQVTALHVAAESGRAEVLKLLIEAGGKVDAKDQSGKTLLHLAVANEQQEVVAYLLSQGIAVNALDNHQATALHVAMGRKNAEILKLLIKQGADVNARDSEGRTALHHGLQGDNRELLKILLASKGIKVDEADKNENTPLKEAFEAKNLEAIQLLVVAGANPNVKSSMGILLLDWVIKEKHQDLLKLLLASKEIKLNEKDARGNTHLQEAFEVGNLEAIQLLVTAGVNPNVNSWGTSLLNWAVKNKHKELLKNLLASKKIKVNTSYNEDDFPLHTAVYIRDLEAVKLLVAAGAHLTVKDIWLQTPLDIAEKLRYDELIPLLQ
eukprot:gene45-65_t